MSFAVKSGFPGTLMGCSSSRAARRLPIRMPEHTVPPGQQVSINLGNRSPDSTTNAVFRMPEGVRPGDTVVFEFLPGRGIVVPPGVLPPEMVEVRVGNVVDQVSLPYGLGPGMRFHYLTKAEGVEVMGRDHPRALPSHSEARQSQLASNTNSRGEGAWGAGETGFFVIGSLMLL